MVNTYEIIYVKGKNCVGKTQWMLLNLGCYPDQKFPDKLTYFPIEGYVYQVNLLPNGYNMPIWIYTKRKINGFQKVLLKELEHVECKILFHTTNYDLIIPVFRQLQHIQMTELYINSLPLPKFEGLIQPDNNFYDLTLGTVKTEAWIFPQSLKRIFIEVRNDDQTLVVQKANGDPFVSPNTIQSLHANVITTLEARLKQIAKKILYWQSKLAVQSQIADLNHQLNTIRNQIAEQKAYLEQFKAKIDQAYKESKEKELEKIQLEITTKLHGFQSEFKTHMLLLVELRNKEGQLSTQITELESQIKRKNPQVEINELKSEKQTVEQNLTLWRNHHDH